jgi:hypothetical protein
MTRKPAVSRYKRMTDNIDHRLAFEQRNDFSGTILEKQAQIFLCVRVPAERNCICSMLLPCLSPPGEQFSQGEEGNMTALQSATLSSVRVAGRPMQDT